MLRPLLLEYPKDPTARTQELSYMLGGSLLVAPPFDREEYQVYLPEGKWLDLTTGEILEGRQYHLAAPALEQLPVYQRMNSILPLLKEEACDYVPEQAFEGMEIQLVYGSEMEAVFYDELEGSIQTFKMHAYDQEDCLFVETDIKIEKITVKSEQTWKAVYLNGVQV